MNYKKTIKKFLIPTLYIIGLLLFMTLFTSTLYYFNIIGDKTFNIMNLLIPVIIFLTGGYLIGKQTTNKGWLEGFKFSLVIVIFMFLLSYFTFHIKISIENTLYYLIVIFISILGSMIGINKHKKD